MTDNAYNSEKLDEIRKKIDALDTRLHETLVERAELVLQIGEEKRRSNIDVVQPAREARMIRRLLSRPMGVLPEMAVVRIWRELVGAVSLLQTGLSVVVSDSETRPEYWDLSKDYFGSCLPMARSPSSLSAINAVREGRTTFAVVPFPHDGPDSDVDNPWWENLYDVDGQTLNISVRLPHGDDPQNKNPDYRALVVSNTGFDKSDDDHSFVYIECEPTMSRGKIADLATEQGFEPVSISSKPLAEDSLKRKHLLEVKGYWRDDADKINELKSNFAEDDILICVGGYPVPATYNKTIVPQKDTIPTAPKAPKA